MSWKLKSVMTEDVVHVLPDTPFKVCVDMIRVHRVGALPVVDSFGRFLGILSESDLLRKEEAPIGLDQSRAAARTAAEAMTRAVTTSTPDATVAEAARLMHTASVRHLPILDGEGRLVGIVSRSDLLKVFLRSDESLRREIAEVLLPQTLGIHRGTVEVEVRDGVVRVSGEVETPSQARLIIALIEHVEGVVGVDGVLGHSSEDPRSQGVVSAG
jgi:CBS-domain-containing membrane protein